MGRKMPCHFLGIKGQGKTFVPKQAQSKNVRRAFEAQGIYGRTHPDSGSAAQLGDKAHETPAGDGAPATRTIPRPIEIV